MGDETEETNVTIIQTALDWSDAKERLTKRRKLSTFNVSMQPSETEQRCPNRILGSTENTSILSLYPVMLIQDLQIIGESIREALHDEVRHEYYLAGQRHSYEITRVDLSTLQPGDFESDRVMDVFLSCVTDGRQ